MGLVINELDKYAANRYSAALVNQLVYLPYSGMSELYQFIIPEIAHLENKSLPTKTIKESSFNRNEMQGIHKKHFYIPNFLGQNVSNHWGLSADSTNTKFDKQFKKNFEEYFASPTEENARKFSSRMANTLVEEVKFKKKTGQYIIFEKHNRQNYYLCLGLHKQDDEILNWVQKARKDFPLLNQS